MKNRKRILLAIDTSCDDTSVAVTCGWEVWSNIVASQVELHKPYGGVFPTVAKQAHKENIEPAVKLALKRAGVTSAELSGVVVTIGPGLAPALEVGIIVAAAFAAKHHLPLYPANHIEGHLWSVLARPRPKITPELDRLPAAGDATAPLATSIGAKVTLSTRQTSNPFQATVNTIKPTQPILGIIISGNTSLFVKMTPTTDSNPDSRQPSTSLRPSTLETVDDPQTLFDRQPNLSLTGEHGRPFLHRSDFVYTVLGQTLDDAAGECLDKIGRMLNLGYPAGPVIEEFAKQGNPRAYPFPLPLTTTSSYDLSFSGLKTFARNLLTQVGGAESLNKQQLYDMTASVQYAVFRHICYKLNKLLLDNLETFVATLENPKASSIPNAGLTDPTNQKSQIPITNPPQLFSEVWLGGGVAANMMIRKMIREILTKYNRSESVQLEKYHQSVIPDRSAYLQLPITLPMPIAQLTQLTLRLRTPYTQRLCGDNAAMLGLTI